MCGQKRYLGADFRHYFKYEIPITYMNARTIKSGHSAVINIGVEIKDLNDIEYIIKKLMTIDGVQKVTRSN